MKEYR